jgi:PAS domain S-box-containing protein
MAGGKAARSGSAPGPVYGGQPGPMSPWDRVSDGADESVASGAAKPELAKAEGPARRNEDILRHVLANTPVMLWAVDRNGAFLLCEGTWPELLGRKPADLMGRSVYELCGMLPNIRENVGRALSGESFTTIADVGGTLLGMWFSPLRGAAGQIVGAVAVAADISSHRQVEGKLLAERRLMTETIRSQEWDRRLMAYEIHDGLIQDLTGAQMQLEGLSETQSVPAGPAREQIELALRLLRNALDEGRRLISGLRHPVLDEYGVVAAINDLVKEQPAGGPSIEFVVDVQFERLEPYLEQAIYRLVQEAIANVRRHSKSSRARIRLTQVDDRIQIEVRDWGVGFDPQHIEGERLGLRGIRERARLLDGRTVVDSSPGKGTRVLVDLPLKPPRKLATMNDRSVE